MYAFTSAIQNFQLAIHSFLRYDIIRVVGMWHSWSARFVHIEEVVGSSPSIPTKQKRDIHLDISFLFVYMKGSKPR